MASMSDKRNRNSNWIQETGISKHKGALHRELHVPAGKKIPIGKLEGAAKQPGKMGRRARLAMTLRKMD